MNWSNCMEELQNKNEIKYLRGGNADLTGQSSAKVKAKFNDFIKLCW